MAAFRGTFTANALAAVIWLFLALARPVRADDVTTVIDDSDPGIKALHGTWSHFKGSSYYNGTETLTRDANAVTMYIFNGTGIQVFGTQCDPAGGNTTVSTYTLDGGASSKYTVPTGVVCNQNFVQFYSSPPLSNRAHTLVITNLNQGAWYFLDYLKVTAPAPTSSSAAPTSTQSAAADSTSAGSQAINPGVIVGIALGVVVLIALAILGALWFRRKRRRSNYPKQTVVLATEDDVPGNVTPYQAPSHPLPLEESTTRYGTRSKGTYMYNSSSRHAISTMDNPSVIGIAPASNYSHPYSPRPHNEMSQVQSSAAADLDPSLVDRRKSVAATIPPAYER